MITRVIYFLCISIVYGITIADLNEFVAAYWAKTDTMIFIVILLFLLLIEVLAFTDELTHIIPIKRRRRLQLGIHIALVVNSYVLAYVHEKSIENVVLFSIAVALNFWLVHGWLHRIHDDKKKPEK